MLPTLPSVTYGDSSEKWVDACTHTRFIYGQPYESIIYTIPQVVDVGQGFVEYNIEKVKENEYWVDCPTSSFYIKTANTEVWTVNRTEQVLNKCIWQLWAQNGSLWIEIEDSNSSFTLTENENSAILNHQRIMQDGSIFNVSWSFENKAKASVTLTTGQSRAYAITWHIECPRATMQKETSHSFTLYEEELRLCLLDYFDARFIHNETTISELGHTGRKAIVTFANMTLETGETITVDPTVDTISGEASRDGYLKRQDAYYPPNSTTVDSTDNIAYIGQFKSIAVYTTYKSFLSFNTTTINQTATIDFALLRVNITYIACDLFVNIKLYSGYYGTTLNTTDWDKCTTYRGVLSNSNHPDGWQDIILPSTVINKTGVTQFKLVSDREEDAIEPELGIFEYIVAYTADSSTPPQLKVYYEDTEETFERKGSGGDEETTDVVEDVVETVKGDIAQRGLYYLTGFIILIAIGGIYASSKKQKLSRKAKGKAGGKTQNLTGTPKKKSRDARGRFK